MEKDDICSIFNKVLKKLKRLVFPAGPGQQEAPTPLWSIWNLEGHQQAKESRAQPRLRPGDLFEPQPS